MAAFDSFDKDELFDPNFDHEDFVSQYRQSSYLEHLSDELARFGNELKLKLVDTLNRDYEDFLKLADALETTPSMVIKVLLPVDALKSKVEGILDADNASISTLLALKESKGTLLHRQQLLIATIALKKASDCVNHSLERIEHFDSIEERCISLQRACHEFKRAKYLSQTLSLPLPIDATTLQRHLCSSFVELIELDDFDGKDSCFLRVLLAFHSIEELELLRDTARSVVRPLIKDHLKSWRTTSDVTKSIETVLSSLFTAIQTKTRLLLSVELNPALSSQLLHYSIWNECMIQFCAIGPILFVPGTPNRFVKHYTASMHFFNAIENLYTGEALLAFKALGNRQTFEIKWNVTVYKEMRVREFTERFQKEMEGGPFHALSELLTVMWSSSVFLNEIADALFELSLRFLNTTQMYLESVQTSDNLSILSSIFADAHKHFAAIVSDFSYHISQYFNNTIGSLIVQRFELRFEHLRGPLDGIKKRVRMQSASNAIEIIRKEIPKVKAVARVADTMGKVPSQYVTDVVLSLERVWKDLEGLGVDRGVVKDVLEDAVVVIMEEFMVMVKRLLSEAKDMEATVKRLNSSRGREMKSKGIVDKIESQLNIDVSSIREKLSLMGISAEF